jgi:hypothetical protein
MKSLIVVKQIYLKCVDGNFLYTILERPVLKGLSTCSQRIKFPPHIGDSNSCPPDLELDALTKWLASQCVSADFSTVLSPVPLWYCT